MPARAGKSTWTYPPTFFVHMELDRANAERVTADIGVLKSKQARMPDPAITSAAHALHLGFLGSRRSPTLQELSHGFRQWRMPSSAAHGTCLRTGSEHDGAAGCRAHG